MAYSAEEFAKQIENFMSDKRLTFPDLYERSGIPVQTLKNWTGQQLSQKAPKREKFLLLAAAFDLTRAETDEFLDLGEHRFPSIEDLNKLFNSILDLPGVRARFRIWKDKIITQASTDFSSQDRRKNQNELPHPPDSVIEQEIPGGAMPLHSPFYIERQQDRDFKEHIQKQGVTFTIKGSGQVGKSSMLNRMKPVAEAMGKKVVILDFNLFDGATRANGELFFRHFCEQITHKLKLQNRIEGFWQWANKSQNCTDYISDYILQTIEDPLLLMMDNVDAIFETAFCTDFFGMIRNWHNSRAIQPLWKKLNFVLVTSTEPLQFIPNVNLSPFNVGVTLLLADFTLDEVNQLNTRYGLPLAPGEVKKLMALVAGHPYLTKQAFYLVASHRFKAEELFEQAADDNGPFGLHLQRHLQRLRHQPEQQKALKLVIEQHNLSDINLFFRLQEAGLVRREKHQIILRCQLYRNYFGARL